MGAGLPRGGRRADVARRVPDGVDGGHRVGEQEALPDRRADFDAMRAFVQRLAASGGVPGHVLWRATDERDDALALTLLVRALLEAGHAAALVAVVDERAPVQEALAGLLRKLPLEQPAWRTVTVTMAADHVVAPESWTGLALHEAATATAPTAEVRYVRRAVDGRSRARERACAPSARCRGRRSSS